MSNFKIKDKVFFCGQAPHYCLSNHTVYTVNDTSDNGGVHIKEANVWVNQNDLKPKLMSKERDFEVSFMLDMGDDGIITDVTEIRTVNEKYWFTLPTLSLLEEMLHEDVKSTEFERSGIYVVSVFEDRNQTEISFRFADYEFVDNL